MFHMYVFTRYPMGFTWDSHKIVPKTHISGKTRTLMKNTCLSLKWNFKSTGIGEEDFLSYFFNVSVCFFPIKEFHQYYYNISI